MNKNGKISGPVINGIRTDVPTHAANYGLHNKIALKTSDQTLTQSSETLQDVTEMLIALAANEKWKFETLILYLGNSTADLDISFAVPSGATCQWKTTGSIDTILDAGDEQKLNCAGTARLAAVHGIVTVGATAGNLQMQGAQNVSTAADTKVLTNSSIVAIRLA